MMIFGYAMFVPTGIALTSAYASQLVSYDVVHTTVAPLAAVRSHPGGGSRCRLPGHRDLIWARRAPGLGHDDDRIERRPRGCGCRGDCRSGFPALLPASDALGHVRRPLHLRLMRVTGSAGAALTAAYAVTVRSLIAVITTLNQQVDALQGQVEAHFGQHPDAEIYRSQPGLGAITGARVLGEFGDDPRRYACAKARKNYAATSPITCASGKRKIVAARFVRNSRLIDALMTQAFAALRGSPGARALYDAERARGLGHNDALRRLANRLVGILHGCLKTRTCYDEATAWGHRQSTSQSPAAA
jgi:Transposase IS116/IS110/IS902 family